MAVSLPRFDPRNDKHRIHWTGALPDPPSYSAVRATMRILEEKGYLKHEKEGRRYIFLSTLPQEKVRRSALKQLIHTFFEGSVEQTVAALLDVSDAELTDADLDQLTRLIEKARKEER